MIFQAMWGKWGAWTACSVTCGAGTRERTRECEDPTGTRFSCSPGAPSESESCNDATCGMYIYVTQMILNH